MMRRRDVFGEDSHVFRPELFLECDSKNEVGNGFKPQGKARRRMEGSNVALFDGC